MIPGIYCLMSGMNLTDEMRNLLLFEAVKMVRDKKSQKAIKGSTFEGEIRTQFKTALIGTTGGFLFAATIESQGKSREVRYIVRSEDYEGIENGQWFSIKDFLEALGFTFESPSASQSQANAYGPN